MTIHRGPPARSSCTSHSRHLLGLNTAPRGHAEFIPQRSTWDEAKPTHYNQTTTQHLLYDFDINKYYTYVVLWFSLLKVYSIPQQYMKKLLDKDNRWSDQSLSHRMGHLLIIQDNIAKCLPYTH